MTLKQPSKERIYNLDGLRFLAAWIVLLVHIEAMKPMLHYAQKQYRFFTNGGQIAVTFFFVLSGFLISYLLFSEKKNNEKGRINVAGFYRKRILRIWPLYYLLVFVVFFLIPHVPVVSNFTGTTLKGHFPSSRLAGYLFFLPNTTEMLQGKEFYLGQTWSLGVEELFYLCFPILVWSVKWKAIPRMLIIVTLFFLVASVGIIVLGHYKPLPGWAAVLRSYYLDRYRIYSFTLGGLAAWMLLEQERMQSIIKWIRRPVLSYLGLLLVGAMVIAGITFSIITQQVYSFAFAIMLLAVVSSGIRFYLLNNKLVVYLGKISYGIYMLHPLAIIIALNLFRNLNAGYCVLALLLGLTATGLTILFAVVSYEFYEKVFLRMR